MDLQQQKMLEKSFISDTIDIKNTCQTIIDLYDRDLLGTNAMSNLIGYCNEMLRKYSIEKQQDVPQDELKKKDKDD